MARRKSNKYAKEDDPLAQQIQKNKKYLNLSGFTEPPPPPHKSKPVLFFSFFSGIDVSEWESVGPPHLMIIRWAPTWYITVSPKSELSF